MSGLQPFTIAGYNAGLTLDKKPFLISDKAFPVLNNAYCWRERIKKRECLQLVGRLRRCLLPQVIGVMALEAGQAVFRGNLITILGLEPTASIAPGSLIVTINGVDWLETVPINGTIINQNGNAESNINYSNGQLFLVIADVFFVGLAVTIEFCYFPGLPVMGIEIRDVPTINFEQTIFFDTVYGYTFDGANFNDIAGFVWTAPDNKFVWSSNYQGADSSIRTFFITKFNDAASSPMRWTQDNITYTDFAPELDALGPPTLLLQAQILIPYYGRLIALNTIEGQAAGLAGNKNFFNRARFSQQGNPLEVDAWRVDIPGKGGFADAPTAEAITSATLYKNTLIVRFEKSTWQLRYVGDYGSPFLFERISSDFGSESPFASILFDEGDLTVGDRAITQSGATTVRRIDEAIPDIVFSILNNLGGPERVHGIRDFRREIVYWCYNDAVISSATQYFPNTVLVFNYRNNTFATFRDNVTTFGTLQAATGVTWDSTNILWDNEEVTWDDVADLAKFAKIVIGNQTGFVHYYAAKTPDDASNYISAINLAAYPIQITVPNHNIADFEIVYISGLLFIDMTAIAVPVATNLNDKIYLAKYVDDNNLTLFRFDPALNPPDGGYFQDFPFTPGIGSPATYVGNGQMAIFPRMNVVTKDFNPFTQKGKQLKISYVDFLMDVTPSTAMSVNLYSNTYQSFAGDINIGQRDIETYQAQPYFGNNTLGGSDILWHRLYHTLTGQMIRIQMTYSDALMNLMNTHQQEWGLNAMTVHARTAGKTIF